MGRAAKLLLVGSAFGLLAVIGGCSDDGGVAKDEPQAAVDVRVTGEGEPSGRMVELFTPYCPACKAMKPVVDSVAQKCDDDSVEMEMVDVSKEGNEDYLERFSVRAVPTFLFIDEAGVEVARLVGVQSEQALEQAFAALGGRECVGLSLVGPGGKTKRGG